jgi:protein SCO1/2
MKSKNIWGILAVILLLVVLPLISYYFLRSGVEARDMRYVDPFAYQNEQGDTINPIFTDQQGDTVTSDMMKGKLKLASFLFSRCTRFNYCDSIPYYMQQIQEHFKAEPWLQLLTYTIDPAHDTTTVLHDWANSWNADTNQWRFVRSGQQHVYQVILGEYFGKVKYADGNVKYMEPDAKVVIVDHEGLIKGYYELQNEKDYREVVSAIDKLLAELEQSSS